MQLYLDSAKLEEIKKLSFLGLIHGVTTNPSLIRKAIDSISDKPDLEFYIKEIIKVSPGPVSIEVISKDTQSMFEEALTIKEKFGKHNKNIVVKIPVCTIEDMAEKDWGAGLSVIKDLSLHGIPVNATLVFNPSQAILAANAGAAYVSPFAGRLDDYLWAMEHPRIEKEKSMYFPKEGLKEESRMRTDEFKADDNGIVSGVHLIEKIVKIFQKSNTKCKVLAASIRNPRQVVEAAEVGADIVTVDYNTIVEMAKHPLTCDGIKLFENDTIDGYRKLFKK